MMWLRRIGLFLMVNILVMLTITTLLNLLGVKPYLTQYGMNYQSLMIYCLVWGMGGAFISLLLSRVMAKWMMKVQVISPETMIHEEKELLDTVYNLARAARLKVMPEVGVYESEEINAFATGPSKSRSLVAVSTGLLNRLNHDQVKGVIGHEIAHIANGDMVTMTLVQGIVNAFSMFLARAIAFALTIGTQKDSNEDHKTPVSYYIIQFVLDIVFMILGTIIIAWFSRIREYRADKGGAQLAGKDNMILALEGLRSSFDNSNSNDPPSIQAFKISNRSNGFMSLFSTHPSLNDRIEKLKNS